MDAEQFRRAGYQAIDRLCDYHSSLRNRPVHIPTSAPIEGEDIQVIADDYQNIPRSLRTSLRQAHSRAYLKKLYASSTSNPGFMSFYNISEVGGGIIQTSASDSALVATVAARSRYIREHPHVAMENLVLYISSQTHSLGKKAGLILGLKVRTLQVTAQDDFALRGDTLKVALEEDVNAGLHPFIL
ncbi:pyridoxal phosphate-dependent transferase, partial [Suillus occidentalis]